MYMVYHISLSVSRYTSLLLRPSLSPSLPLSSLPLFLFLCCLFFFHSFFPSLHLSLSQCNMYMQIWIIWIYIYEYIVGMTGNAFPFTFWM